MTFADLVAGDAVFVDANTFVYHFAPDPMWGAACAQLLQRIENQEFAGFTSSATLNEVAHRLMTIEARIKHGWSSGKVLPRLKQNPNIVQALTSSGTAVAKIIQSRVHVFSVDASLIVAAVNLCRQTGLLLNDSLMLAVMQANGLTRVASNDADLDRVPAIVRFAPS